MDLSGVVPLEVVGSSSEEPPFAAKRLSSRECVPVLRGLLTGELCHDVGWRAEKFCEYPQEIVLRVCRSSSGADPCSIHSLVVVSDASLIARRIEIFLSSSPTRDWRKARFERLGFITLQGPQETQCVAQELKTVSLPSSDEKLTFIRLLVHTCHVHTANLFNQVGLTCVAAIQELATRQGDEHISVVEAIQRRVDAQRSSFDEEPLPSVPEWPTGASRRRNPYQQRAPAPHAIWIAERNEYVTPVELLTRIQLARERHGVIVAGCVHTSDDAVRFQHDQKQWAVDELECARLGEKLTQLQDDEVLARSVADRLRVRKQIDAVGECVRELDARVRCREAALQRCVNEVLVAQLANSPVKSPKGSPVKALSVFRERDTWQSLESWQAREEFLWKIVGAVKRVVANGDLAENAIELDEAVQIAMAGLTDRDSQVFIAANTLLTTVIQHHPRFQEGSAWKDEVSVILKKLVSRLDDHQPPVRNNAAFSLVKVAELTRARGTFVMHTLLVHCEKLSEAMSDQTLYGLLKVFSALLLSFHCCATIDIPAKRVLQFMMRHDALVHDNGHVREAARQLLVVLQSEVGSEQILTYLRKKKQLPDDILREVEQLMEVLTSRKEYQATGSLDSAPSVL